MIMKKKLIIYTLIIQMNNFVINKLFYRLQSSQDDVPSE